MPRIRARQRILSFCPMRAFRRNIYSSLDHPIVERDICSFSYASYESFLRFLSS